MKLSEAINLGAPTVEHPSALILGRCALGMAQEMFIPAKKKRKRA